MPVLPEIGRRVYDSHGRSRLPSATMRANPSTVLRGQFMKPRLALVGVAVVAAAALAACGPDTSGSTSGPGSSATSAAPAAAAGRDACLTGTWHVDVQDLATQTATKAGKGGRGTGSGTITVTFGDAMTIDYAYVLTITTPSSQGMAIGVKDDFRGAASSTDYQASGGHLTGTMATNTVSLTTSIIVNGHAQGGSAQALNGVLDLSKGVTSYTCSGSSMTMANGVSTWHLSKA
jgi:hypothetical protein